MHLLIYGLVNSAIFVLVALGFTFVYGISRIPNFAHGASYVLVGFMTWTFLNSIGIHYLLAIILSLVLVALLGAAIYKMVLIKVRTMATSEIIASFAIGLIILEGLRIQGIGNFKGFIGPYFVIPPFIDGSIDIGGVFIDYQRLIVIAAGIIVVGFLWFMTHHTKIGLSLRAVAQDEQAAMMIGINSNKAAMLSLAIGSALAGLAAVIILPLGNITPESGYKVLIDAIAICIIGGLGSWAGAILGSFVLGFVTILTDAFIGFMWQQVVVVTAIILILVLRPSGLLGKQKQLEERV